MLLVGFPEWVTGITGEWILLALVKQQGGSLSSCTGEKRLILSAKEKVGVTKERTSDYCMFKEKLGISDCTEPVLCPRGNKRRAVLCSASCQSVGWPECLPAKCLSCHELGTPRFQLPVPMLLDSQLRLFPLLPSFSGQSILQSGWQARSWVCPCKVPQHRHFVAQSNPCSFLLFSFLVTCCPKAVKNVVGMVSMMCTGMALLCRVKCWGHCRPMPCAATCLHPLSGLGFAPQSYCGKRPV